MKPRLLKNGRKRFENGLRVTRAIGPLYPMKRLAEKVFMEKGVNVIFGWRAKKLGFCHNFGIFAKICLRNPVSEPPLNQPRPVLSRT
jgi:hypothetical protein